MSWLYSLSLSQSITQSTIIASNSEPQENEEEAFTQWVPIYFQPQCFAEDHPMMMSPDHSALTTDFGFQA